MEIYFKNLTPEGTPEKLLQDLNTLGQNTEELFRASEGKLAAKSRDKFLNGLERVKATCRRMQEQTDPDHSSNGVSATSFPYTTMGIVFGLGLLAGVLTTRRGR
jgi:ElaB/YqjD/DUF883 family membrane-anchored ribosome-binding protein